MTDAKAMSVKNPRARAAVALHTNVDRMSGAREARYESVVSVYGARVRPYRSRVREYATLVQAYATLVQTYATLVQAYETLVQPYATLAQVYATPVQPDATSDWPLRPKERGGAGGGNRTLTGGKPHRILSPARLPVSPLRREYGRSGVGIVFRESWLAQTLAIDHQITPNSFVREKPGMHRPSAAVCCVRTGRGS